MPACFGKLPKQGITYTHALQEKRPFRVDLIQIEICMRKLRNLSEKKKLGKNFLLSSSLQILCNFSTKNKPGRRPTNGEKN